MYEGGALGSEETLIERRAADPVGRKEILKQSWFARDGKIATTHRDVLVEWYGEKRAAEVRTAEAFEVCEYGRQPKKSELRELFPFFDEK